MFTKRWKIGVAVFLCMVLAAGCATVPSASSDAASTSSALSQSTGTAVSSKEAVSAQAPVSSQAAQDETTPCIPNPPENMVQPEWVGLSLSFTPSLMRQTVCNFAYIDANGALHFAPSFLKASPTARALEGKRGAQAVAAAYPGVLVLWEDGSVDIAACTSPVQLLKDGADAANLLADEVNYGDAKTATAARAALLDAWDGKKAYAVGALSVYSPYDGEEYQGAPWMLTTDSGYYIGKELVATGVKYAGGRAVLFHDNTVGYFTPDDPHEEVETVADVTYRLNKITDEGWTDLVQVQEYQGYVIGLKKDGTVISFKTELARKDVTLLLTRPTIALVPNSGAGLLADQGLYPIFPVGEGTHDKLPLTVDRVVPFWYSPTFFLSIHDDGSTSPLVFNDLPDEYIDKAWAMSIDNVKTSDEPHWLLEYKARFAPELLVTYENKFNAEEPIPLTIELFAETKDLRWVPRETTFEPRFEKDVLATQEALRNATPFEKQMYNALLERYTLDRSSATYGMYLSLNQAYRDCDSYELTVYHFYNNKPHISGTYTANGTCSFWLEPEQEYYLTYELKIKTEDGKTHVYTGDIRWLTYDVLSTENVVHLLHECRSDAPLDVEPYEGHLAGSSDYFTYIADDYDKMYACEEDSDKALLRTVYYYNDDNGHVIAGGGDRDPKDRTLEFTYDPSKNEQTVQVNGVACDFVREGDKITITRDGWFTIQIEGHVSSNGIFLMDEQFTYELTDTTIRFTSPQTKKTDEFRLEKAGMFFYGQNGELYAFDYREP